MLHQHTITVMARKVPFVVQLDPKEKTWLEEQSVMTGRSQADLIRALIRARMELASR
jgi:hypothetical protein